MKLDVLIGCACSGIMGQAFRALGHNAWECDLKPSEASFRWHIQGDVRDHLSRGWHLAILHPVCTRLTNAGVRWLTKPPPGRTVEEMWTELQVGCDLFADCLNADIDCLAVENPVMHRYAKERIRGYRPFTQSVHPWMFGAYESGPDNVKKRTCWWLKNLTRLEPLDILDGSTARAEIHEASPGENRAAERSRSFPGMCAAAADRWSADAVSYHKFGLLAA